MNAVIFSSDVDYLQSNLIVFQNNTCIWLDYDHDSNNYIVYTFDLLTSVESWIDLDDINSSCDTNYTSELNESDFIQFTSDVCWYYGAMNLDGCPFTFNDVEVLELIESLSC